MCKWNSCELQMYQPVTCAIVMHVARHESRRNWKVLKMQYVWFTVQIRLLHITVVSEMSFKTFCVCFRFSFIYN